MLSETYLSKTRYKAAKKSNNDLLTLRQKTSEILEAMGGGRTWTVLLREARKVAGGFHFQRNPRASHLERSKEPRHREDSPHQVPRQGRTTDAIVLKGISSEIVRQSTRANHRNKKKPAVRKKTLPHLVYLCVCRISSVFAE